MAENIFNALANFIIGAQPPGQPFHHAKLFIKRLEGNAGYSGSYFNEDGTRETYLDVWNFHFNGDLIHDLYRITMNEPLTHKNWNRAIFTLYRDGKFNMEYIWDQALQDETDRLNRD
jgi:hypothetical protein